jgi:hypothetical protein
MSKFWDWMVLLLYVAIIFLFVRPGSKGVDLVSGIGSNLVNLVTSVTGGGKWSG